MYKIGLFFESDSVKHQLGAVQHVDDLNFQNNSVWPCVYKSTGDVFIN